MVLAPQTTSSQIQYLFNFEHLDISKNKPDPFDSQVGIYVAVVDKIQSSCIQLHACYACLGWAASECNSRISILYSYLQ